MTCPWHTLLWDLDGTIVDPREGIIGAYSELLKEWDLPVPHENELRWVIGPPLRDCLKIILGVDDPATIEQAVVRYRYWYVNEGAMYRDKPYDGIREILQTLQDRGIRMFIATAKAHSYAKQILDHWNLGGFFEQVHGSELDGTRSNKAILLQWMLEQYQISPSRQIAMIGDRKHDAVAAQANALSSIGVGYGYGTPDELKAAKVDFYCPSVADLQSLLIPQSF